MLQVNDVELVELLAEAVEGSADILSLLGYLCPVNVLEDRDKLMKQVLSYYMVGHLQPGFEH